MLALRRVRTSQPRGPVGIDWSNSVTQGALVFADNAAVAFDEAGGKSPNAYANKVIPTSSGLSATNEGGSTYQHFYAGNIQNLSAAGDKTLLCVAVASPNNYNGSVFSYNNNPDTAGMIVYQDTGGLGVYSGQGGNWVWVGFGTNRLTPASSTIVVTYKAGTGAITGYLPWGEYSGTGAAGTSGCDSVAFSGYVNNDALSGRTDNLVALGAIWNRALNPEEARSLLQNPWQIFAPEFDYYFPASGSQPQLLAPIADISAGGWTPSSGADLYAMLDEATASDTDYIVSSTESTCEIQVAVGANPAVSTGHILRYRLLAGSGTITARLKQGASTIATFGPHTLTGAAQDFAQTLTAGEADSITNYADLRVSFEAA